MKTTIRWTKGFFKNRYELFLNGSIAGSLKDKNWSQSSDGEFNGKQFLFKTTGFFKQSTQITNSFTNEEVGRISYNSWGTRAIISIANKTVEFKYTNTWNTRWILYDNNGVLIHYRGTETKGDIEMDTLDELLVLSGLFIKNHFSQSAALIIVILIPIFIATNN